MKTVKVRIAVIVDAFGDWGACGWERIPVANDTMTARVSPKEHAALVLHEANTILSSRSCGRATYWLEAELPIPQETVVQASVEAVSDD